MIVFISMSVCGVRKYHRENLKAGQVKGVSIVTTRQSVGYKKGELSYDKRIKGGNRRPQRRY